MATIENMANDNFDEGLDQDFLNLVGDDQQDESTEEVGESFEEIFSREDGEGQPEAGEEEQATDEQEEETAQNDQGKPNGTNGEPGYVKKRVTEAVEKALERERSNLRAEVYAEVKAEFDKQLAPLIARLREDEAQELVRSRKVTDIDTARELVRLRHGVSEQPTEQPVEQTEQPRNAQGQFVAKEQNDDVSAASTYLAGQANRIKAETGIDVMAVFNKDASIRNKILSGEMDFHDVAKQMQARKGKKPPAPMRSPNRTDDSIKVSIMDMSDEQFEQLEKAVRRRG